MNKVLMIVALSLISATAFAGSYAGVDYSYKDKDFSTQGNDVIGLTVGNNSFDNKKVTVEARIEDEFIHNPAKHEGLVQGRVAYNLFTVLGVSPYIAGAYGYKSKATSNFGYYVLEGGLKTSLSKNLDLKLASRLRSPFDEHQVGEGNKYRTVENSVGLIFKLNPHNAFTAKAAKEHGDSDYNTVGVGYVYTF